LIPEHLGAGDRGHREKQGGCGGDEPRVRNEHGTPREKWQHGLRRRSARDDGELMATRQRMQQESERTLRMLNETLAPYVTCRYIISQHEENHIDRGEDGD